MPNLQFLLSSLNRFRDIEGVPKFENWVYMTPFDLILLFTALHGM